jgi:hypothetical protein
MFRVILNRPFLVSVMWLLSAPVLVACAKPTVDVSIHGVNYSGTAFSYYVVDPAHPNSSGTGELIDPFAAGGTVCCFSMPKKWRPGIKVRIHSTHWLPNLPDGSFPEVKEVHFVDVPPYVNGTPGELWILRGVDGSISVISSDFQPDHSKWPGKLKGWPVASVEYRRERWKLMKEHEEDGVELYLSLLDELEKEPQSRARDSWAFAKEHDPSITKRFSGPDDPGYLLFLKENYTLSLERSRKLLKNVMESRP